MKRLSTLRNNFPQRICGESTRASQLSAHLEGKLLSTIHPDIDMIMVGLLKKPLRQTFRSTETVKNVRVSVSQILATNAFGPLVSPNTVAAVRPFSTVLWPTVDTIESTLQVS